MNIFRCTIVVFAICLTLIMMNLLVRLNFRHSHSLPHATKTSLPSKKKSSSNLLRSFFHLPHATKTSLPSKKNSSSNVPHATKTNIEGKNPKKKTLLRLLPDLPHATDTRPQKYVHCRSTGRLANRVRFAVSCYLFAKLTGRKMSFDSVNVNETEVQRYLPFFRLNVPRLYPTDLTYAKIVNFFDPLDRNNLACTKLDAPDLIIFRGNHFFAPYLLYNPHYNTTGITISKLVYELFYIPPITSKDCVAFQVRNGDKASDNWVSDEEIRAMINKIYPVVKEVTVPIPIICKTIHPYMSFVKYQDSVLTNQDIDKWDNKRCWDDGGAYIFRNNTLVKKFKSKWIDYSCVEGEHILYVDPVTDKLFMVAGNGGGFVVKGGKSIEKRKYCKGVYLSKIDPSYNNFTLGDLQLIIEDGSMDTLHSIVFHNKTKLYYFYTRLNPGKGDRQTRVYQSETLNFIGKPYQIIDVPYFSYMAQVVWHNDFFHGFFFVYKEKQVLGKTDYNTFFIVYGKSTDGIHFTFLNHNVFPDRHVMPLNGFVDGYVFFLDFTNYQVFKINLHEFVKQQKTWFIAADSMHAIDRFATIMQEEYNINVPLMYQTGKERKTIFGALIDIRGIAKCHTRFISAWSSFGEFGWVLANASGITYVVSDGKRIPEMMEPDQEGMLPMKAKPVAPYLLFQLEGDAIFSNAEWREWKTMFTCNSLNNVDYKYGAWSI